jgi:recombination protein RecA
MYNQGISYEGDVINTGIKYGVVSRAGASYSFGEEKLGVGFEAAQNYLTENPQMTKKIVGAVHKATQKQPAKED